MSRLRIRRASIPAAIAFAALTFLPRLAEAQHGPVHGPAYRPVVVVGGYRYPPYFYYNGLYNPYCCAPWAPYPYGLSIGVGFSYGHVYPYGYGYPYAYGYPYGYGYAPVDLTSSVRLQVTPREAQVFVDGYAAGVVNSYDGTFQRLRVRPGGHEITVYMTGYRTIRQTLYLTPGGDQKIQTAMEPLPNGEVAEPPPPPAPPAANPSSDRPDTQSPSLRVMPARPLPSSDPSTEIGLQVNGPAPLPEDEPRPTPAVPGRDRFGSLAVRVQPGDAEIFVDGERWTAPTDQDRVTISLSEGRHHIDVRKSGFNTYSEDVLIRRGNTLTLNVSLR